MSILFLYCVLAYLRAKPLLEIAFVTIRSSLPHRHANVCGKLLSSTLPSYANFSAIPSFLIAANTTSSSFLRHISTRLRALPQLDTASMLDPYLTLAEYLPTPDACHFASLLHSPVSWISSKSNSVCPLPTLANRHILFQIFPR